MRWLQFGQYLEELAHGVCPGHADILVQEHEEIAIPRPGLFLPCSAQVQLGQCLLIGQMVALGLDDDDFLPTFMTLLPTFNLKVGRKLLKSGQRNSNQPCSFHFSMRTDIRPRNKLAMLGGYMLKCSAFN